MARPDRVLNLVPQQPAAPSGAVPPLVLLEPVLGRVLGRYGGLGLGPHAHPAIRTLDLESVLDQSLAPTLFDTVRDPGLRVRLVVDPSCNGRDEAARDQFSDENHAAPTAFRLTHIEPEVDFREVHEARPLDAEHARLKEAKPNETADRLPLEPVEFQPRRQTRLKQRRINRIVREDQIPPLGPEEDALHGSSVRRGAHVCSGVLASEDIQTAARWLNEARSVVVLTGAGVSAESGLATFRDPEEGLWAKYDPMELATIDAFNRDPELVTRWYHWRFTKARDVEPNPGHYALAQIEERLAAAHRDCTIVTQNVDGLHQRAGSERVIEIHGTILRWRCTRTGQETQLEDLSFDTFPVQSEHAGLMRPCVVWFGEMLPERAMADTSRALESCDLFLSIGTSATVWPAANFIDVAKRAGARTIEINRDPTPNSGMVDLAIQGPSGTVLPAVVDAMRELDDS